MHTPQSLVKESIELISLPDVYIRLRDIISSPDYSMADIAQVVAHDPAITARLLKLVNSPFFGLRYKVDTMTHAINLLGTDQVHDLVLATVVVDTFSGFTNDLFNIYDFWYQGEYCAVTARLLAYHCGDMDTERPFIAGLLHNIGHLLMYQHLPGGSRLSLDHATEKDLPLYLAEREYFNFDYAQVGAELMREWHLPESLQEITELHIEPEKAAVNKIETAIVHIASIITKNALAEIPVNADTLDVNPICWDLTGLAIEEMPAIKNEVDQQAMTVMNLLFTHTKVA